MGEGPSPPQFGFAPRQLVHMLFHRLFLLCQHSKHWLRIPQLVKEMVLLMLPYTDYSRALTSDPNEERELQLMGSAGVINHNMYCTYVTHVCTLYVLLFQSCSMSPSLSPLPICPSTELKCMYCIYCMYGWTDGRSDGCGGCFSYDSWGTAAVAPDLSPCCGPPSLSGQAQRDRERLRR